MPRSKTKRLLIAGAGIVGILAIVGASFFVHYSTSHAAASETNPHVLSSNFLSTHHAQAGYGNLPSRATAKVNTKAVGHNPNKVSSGGNSACVPGINGISNFCTTFSEPGLDAAGNPNNNWTTNLVGNPPQNGGTTTIGAPIIPVKVVLMGADGTPAFIVDPEGDVQPVVNSPIYSATKFSSSSKPTQFADAVQRAEFNSVEKTSWHTLLAPSVKPEVTMTIPSGDWFVGLNADGSVAFTLVDAGTFNSLLFPSSFPVDNSTLIGQEELNGTMTTHNISTFLFDNVYLFENGDPNQCCVLGFHGPDIEPGPNRTLNNFAMIYASWMTPGLFLGGGADITALSHEMSETYNDPFSGVYFPFAYVPWWFSGPDPSFTQCQPVMEVGDVVEVYTVIRDDVTNITMNGRTYHPQTEALLQWFESNGTSDAINGAFSYPDESILKEANISQGVTFDAQGNPTCTGPLF